MKKINKMLNLGLALIILGSMMINLDRVLLTTMSVVDIYGDITNTNVCNIIDGLNEVYYNLMNN